jgi:hypothetical protein
MLCMKVIAPSTEIHIKHVNLLCGQNVLLSNVVVHEATAGLWRVNCLRVRIWE